MQINGGFFKRLMSYLKPYKFLTAVALALLLLTTVVRSVIPLIASYFIDHFLTDMNQTAMLIFGWLLSHVCLADDYPIFREFLFCACVIQRCQRHSSRCFCHMEKKLGMAYFDQTPAGSIVVAFDQ